MKNEDGGDVVRIDTSLEMLQEWERDRALKGKKKEAQLARSLDPAFKMMVIMVKITHTPKSLVYIISDYSSQAMRLSGSFGKDYQ